MNRAFSAIRARYLVVLALLTLAPVAPVVSQAGTGPLALPPADAERTLERYFDALRRGDPYSVRRVLGCGLLAKRRPVLARPDFSQRAAERYGRARMQVRSYRMVSRDAVWVEAVFSQPDLLPEARRFLLRRSSEAPDGFVVCVEKRSPKVRFAALELTPRSAAAGPASYSSPPPAPGPSFARTRPDSAESMMRREAQPPPSILP